METDTLIDQLIEETEGEETEDEDINLDDIFGPSEETLTPREREMKDRLDRLEGNTANAQNRQLQEQHNTVLYNISQLPPDQQQAAAYVYNLYLTAQQATQERDGAVRYAKTLEKAAVPFVQDKLYNDISTKAKLERGIIAKYGTDPKTAKAVVGALLEQRKANNLAARKSSGQDGVPSGNSQSSSQSTNSQVKSKFQNSGDIEGFLKAGGFRRSP